MSRYKRFWVLLLSAVLMAALLTGCGAPDQKTAGQDHYLRVGWCSEPDILNPLTSYSTESLQITGLVYETLLTYNAKMEPIPALAERYEYSADYKTVTYHLVKNARWHDGQPFTSADVVDTFQRIKDYQIGEAVQYIKGLTSLTAPDDYTVVMEFAEAQAFNIVFVVPILPKHIWGEMTAEEVEAYANDHPIGTGPYQFVEWVQGSTCTVKRNPDYHGQPANPDGVIWVLYGNEDVAAQALKSGEVDILTEVSATLFDSLKGVENVTAVSLPSYSFHYIGFNSYQAATSKGNKMLLDRTVRQALAYCLNRDQMVELCQSGYGQPATSVLPSAFSEWKRKFAPAELINNDLTKAAAILDAAGYVDSDGDKIRDKNGQPMEFRLYTVETTASDVRAGQMFRDAAAKIGVKITINTMDENTLGGIVYDTEAADFDIVIWAWDSDYPDPSYLLGITLTDQIGNNNEVYYSNPAYDALYEQQAIQMDLTKRKATINEMEKLLYDDCAFNILWYQDKLQAYRTDRFTGWQEAEGGIIYSPTYVNYIRVQPVL